MHQKLRSFNVLSTVRGKRQYMRLVFAAVAGAVVVIVVSRLPLAELAASLLAAHPVWLAAAIFANLAVYPLWIAQWRLLVPPPAVLSWPRIGEIVVLSSLANNTLFKAAGLAASAVLLVTRGRMDSAGAVSLLTLDQLLAGLTKALVLLLAVSATPLPGPAADAALAFSGAVLLLLVIVVTVSLLPEPSIGSPLTTLRLPRRLAGFVGRVTASLRLLYAPRRAAAVVLLALAKKGTELLAAFAVQGACGIELSWVSAIVAVAAVSVATALPLVPGSVGIYSAAVFGAYRLLGVPPSQALAAGILQHAVELVPALVIGYGTLVTTSSATVSQGQD